MRQKTARRQFSLEVLRSSAEFRSLWVAVVISQIGDWIQLTALGWYVLEIGGTAAAVASVTAAGILPQLLLTLIGGIAADRWPKRSLLRGIAFSQLLVAVLFATLIGMGVLAVPGLTLFAFLLGCLTAIWQPIYLSFIPDLVPSDKLENAMGLSLSALYTARTVGPAIAGALIVTVGTEAAFFLNSATFLALIFALKSIGTLGDTLSGKASPIQTLRESTVTVVQDRVLAPLWVATASLSLLALPCLALVPVYVKDVFGSGPQTLGALMTSAGVGQLAGATLLSLGAIEGIRRGGLLQLLGYAAMGFFLLLFARSSSVPVALVALLLFNLLHGLLSPRVNAIVQFRVAEGRGTAQSLFLLVFGLVPIGQLLLGWLANQIGPVNATFLFASGFTVAAGLLLLTAQALKRYESVQAAPEGEPG